jgi:zinc transport system substrate-binding protein
MRTVTSRVIGFVLVALAFAEGRSIGAAEINVVASIKPVHSLVAGVMEGVAEPVLLIRGTGSEHSYSLRPSQARALDQADVVFWVGETMETFLLKPLQAFSGDAKVIELWQIPGLALRPTREGGMWEAHDHGNERADADPDRDEGEHVEENEDEGEPVDADHEATERQAHGETDMHIWLDPANAKVLVPAIATALGDADPANASTYQVNAARLGQRLDELDRSLENRLATVADRPYVVFHDAYQYFEHRYGVNAVGAITINPTVRPSAQRLKEIQGRLEELDAACVFAEPQFEPTLVDTVIEGTNARKGVLDPLGADLDAGPDQYFLLMSNLADALADCLGAAKPG